MRRAVYPPGRGAHRGRARARSVGSSVRTRPQPDGIAAADLADLPLISLIAAADLADLPPSAGRRPLATLSLAGRARAVGAEAAVPAAAVPAAAVPAAARAVGTEARVSRSEVRTSGAISGAEVHPVDLLLQRVYPSHHRLLGLAPG